MAKLRAPVPAQNPHDGGIGHLAAVDPAFNGSADWGTVPVGATDIDDAIMGPLRAYMNTYLTQLEAVKGLDAGYYPRITDDKVVNALSTMEFLDETLPAIIVTTAPTQGTPTRSAVSDRAGVYAASWRVTVSSIVRGPDKAQTRYNASNFEVVVRWLLLDQVKRWSGTPITEVGWTGTLVAPVADATGNGRYLAAGTGQYLVSVDEAAHEDSGPLIPDAAPYGNLPVVSDYPVDLEPLTIEEPE